MNKKIQPRYLAVAVGIFAILWLSVIPFYPLRFYGLFSCFFLAILIVSRSRPEVGLGLLLAASPFFGNHPGGRFMEIYDLGCLLWSGIVIARVWKSEYPLKLRGDFYFVISISLLALMAIAWRFEVWLLFSGYRARPFDFFTGNEHTPHYVVRITLISILVSVALLNCDKRKLIRSTISGVLIAFISVVLLGIFDIAPQFQALLNRYHLWIGGAAERATHYQIISQLSGCVLQFASNSTFWNRTWYSVFLVATAPWVLLRLELLGKRARLIAKIVLFVILFICLFTSGARGGLIAYFVLLISYIWFNVLRMNVMRRIISVKWLLMVPGIIALSVHVLSPAIALIPNLAGERSAQALAGLGIWKAATYLGFGMESYGVMNDSVLTLPARYGTAHNQFLQILTGLGIAGGLLYLTSIWLTYTRIRYAAIRAGIVAALVYGSGQEWWYLRSTHVLWLIVIILGLSRFRVPESWNFLKERWLGVATIILGVVCILGIVRYNMEDEPEVFPTLIRRGIARPQIAEGLVLFGKGWIPGDASDFEITGIEGVDSTFTMQTEMVAEDKFVLFECNLNQYWYWKDLWDGTKRNPEIPCALLKRKTPSLKSEVAPESGAMVQIPGMQYCR